MPVQRCPVGTRAHVVSALARRLAGRHSYSLAYCLDFSRSARPAQVPAAPIPAHQAAELARIIGCAPEEAPSRAMRLAMSFLRTMNAAW